MAKKTTTLPPVTENYKGRVISITGTYTESEDEGVATDIWARIDGRVVTEVDGGSTQEVLESARRLIDSGKI